MRDFQMEWHDNPHIWPEWGSSPRGPLIRCDGAHQGELMDSVIGPDVVTGKPMVYHIVRCELCIAIHAWPLPSTDDLAYFYRETFYQHDKPDYLERTERDSPWWEQCVWYPLLTQSMAALQCPLRDVRPLRYLDIGAGPAISLDVGAALGLQTYGIEPNKTVCDLAASRGHQMFHGPLETFHSEQRFHLITAYEVLEHQPEPEDFLLRCWELLAPGGILAIQVPNDFNPCQLEACQRFGLSRYWIAVPQHLLYWSPKTLQLQLRRAGFRLVDMRGTYPLERFMLDDSLMYIGNDTIGRQIHQRRMTFELEAIRAGRWNVVTDAYRENMQRRIGREILAIAQKEG